MAFVRIEHDVRLDLAHDCDLGDTVLARAPAIDDLGRELGALREHRRRLDAVPIDALVAYMDALSAQWAEPTSPVAAAFGRKGLAFLLGYMRRERLTRTLDVSLRGDRHHLDGWRPVDDAGAHVAAQPRGLVAHWLAGNVPMLGVLSWLQATLARNVSVLKLPRENGRILPALLAHVARTDLVANGVTVEGRWIAGAALCVHAEHDDPAHAELSLAADLRVAWGGRDAVEAVRALPRRADAHDLVFGPKYSFAVIGREALASPTAVERLARGLALDASAHEQHGCNAPHTAFVETGGPVTPLDFARALADAMAQVLVRHPKAPITADEARRIVELRAEHVLDGRVFRSAGTEWTVLYTDEAGCAPPCFNRVVSVRPVASADHVLPWIERGHQTMGLAMGAERARDLALRATRAGIERVVPIGRMSEYDVPWDGVFPIDRMVRWVGWTSADGPPP